MCGIGHIPTKPHKKQDGVPKIGGMDFDDFVNQRESAIGDI